MQNYRITFLAVESGALSDDVRERLQGALEDMPGVDDPGGARVDGDTVGAAFSIRVANAMAQAARDGSRLAKEALKSAGMPDSKLVDLRAELVGDAE